MTVNRLSSSPLCSATGKTRYRLKKTAKRARSKLRKVHGKEFKIYRCPDCRTFHLATVRKKGSVKK